ncbi:chloramphenicol phosphotransferase CPT family protein [Melittangium boletus]|uniref:Chloramphenicol phosphotransferase n=1 Tax=Melittangium boletus DSM 14713 TaxID=1294270 RepID=A0A250ISY8_9BACT|nr:chloramphenicol phosphotransferase [Melittangium boletus]ATB34350.1 chloramphenicol phosphotransferase [Melittangium boletus DSM 14713]
MQSGGASGNVIVLNGPSVAGKTSIQKKLQEAFEEPYMAMGIDSILVAMLPTRYFMGTPPDREQLLHAESSVDESGAPLFTLRFGPKGRRVVAGMHRAIAAFAEQGNNVIVDYILYERDWLPDLANALRSVNAYFVGVRIPLEILEERERQRATSPRGHARSHYTTVHAHGVYDLEVDTSRASPEECAAQISEYVRTHPQPTAFEQLRKRFQ